MASFLNKPKIFYDKSKICYYSAVVDLPGSKGNFEKNEIKHEKMNVNNIDQFPDPEVAWSLVKDFVSLYTC